MRRIGRRRWALGLLLLLGLLLPAAAQAQSAPEPAAASAVNATSEATTPEEEADDAGGHVASEGVCESPPPVSPSRLQCNETSEGAAEHEAAPEPAAAGAGGITPPPGQQWEPALAANDSVPATNGTTPGGALAEDEAEQHNFALEKDGAWLAASLLCCQASPACPSSGSSTPPSKPCHARPPAAPCPRRQGDCRQPRGEEGAGAAGRRQRHLPQERLPRRQVVYPGAGPGRKGQPL